MNKKINPKKAQLKIQEMSFMILGLVLFFIIAGLFFLTLSNTGLKKDYLQLSREKSLSVIDYLSKTPEFSCSNSFSMCIDTDKLLVLKEHSDFKNFWEVEGGLVVKRIYPQSEKERECDEGNYKICNRFTLKEPISGDYEEISSFVLLCRKKSISDYVYDKCEIGVISAYIKKTIGES